MAFRPSIPALIPSADGKTFGIRNWRVFGPGLWNGELFTPARIAAFVNTYRDLRALIPGYSPKLRFGHDTQQRLAKQLGLPNAGRVIDARLGAGSGVDVDLDGVPKTVLVPDARDPSKFVAFDLESALANGNYDGGSIELKRKFRHPLDPQKLLYDVFDGIALLGEEHPACRTTGGAFARFSSDPSADLNRLSFSAFTPEDFPVDLQSLAAAIAALPPDQLAQLMTMVQPAAPAMPGDTAAPVPPTDAMTAKFSAMETELIGLRHRQAASEAAFDDHRKVMAGNATNGMVTMSEANRRIDECVSLGKFPKPIGDAKKVIAKEFLGLPANQMNFSDGAHKGLSQLGVFLAELEARPSDIMLSEIIPDAEPVDTAITPAMRSQMMTTRTGQEDLAWHDSRAKAKSA